MTSQKKLERVKLKIDCYNCLLRFIMLGNRKMALRSSVTKLPQVLKNCLKSNKSPNLVTLLQSQFKPCQISEIMKHNFGTFDSTQSVKNEVKKCDKCVLGMEVDGLQMSEMT